MRRITLLLTVAGIMALMLSFSAGPASAASWNWKHHHNDNDGFRVVLGIGDTENESGDIETENNFVIGGNNNACLGTLQFGNTGNFTNQQGVTQFFSVADDIEFEGGEITFAPENETACDQSVEQAAAASSWGW